MLTDGDAYNGGAFGVLNENNAQFLTQISAIFSASSSPDPTGSQESGNGVTAEQEMDALGMKMTAKNRPGRTYFPPHTHQGT